MARNARDLLRSAARRSASVGRSALIEEEQIQVLPAKTVLVLQSGSSRISYACNPACMPTVQLGDDDKTFKDVGEQMSTRNGYAAGAGTAAK
jgi:hypothetical protein